MKVTILQSNLAKALNQVAKIVSSRTTLPVLNNILIEAKKNKINFSATDLEIGIKTNTIGKIEEEGDITLPAKLLSDFVLNNNDETIEMSVSENKANLRSSHYEATINGIAANEFPSIPVLEKESYIEININEIMPVLKKVAIAPATDETRPVLAGVFFQFNKKELILAATDSYRLAEAKTELTNEIEEKKIIVPTRAVNELIRLVGSADEEKISLAFNENQISFKIGESYIVSRLIEGSYPNYQQIIPNKFGTNIELSYSDLVKAVKMSSLFARDSANNNIRIKILTNEIEISSIISQAGEAKSKIESKVSGNGLEIAFNAKYLLDVLQILPDKEIIMSFNDGNSSGIVKSKGLDNFIYLIMPLKLE